MKNFLILLIFIFSNFSFAKEICTFKWDLSTKGISLGQSSDQLEYKANGLTITSKFNPSGFFLMFGVNQFNRIVSFDLDNNIIFRSEEKIGDNSEKTTWQKNNKHWLKKINNENEEIFTINNNNIIDSTTLPYLAQLQTIDVFKKESNVTVLSKGSRY